MISSTTSYLSIPTIKRPPELPPTPSSSYCHSVASRDSRFSTLVERQTDRLTFSSSSTRLAVPKTYGSILSIPLADDVLSFDSVAPPTPPHTTIRPDEDDEGLYLLWKHQLLREQGFHPSSCHPDDSDDDSSLSDSSLLFPPSTSYTNRASYINRTDPFVTNNSPYSFSTFISACLCLS